MCHVNRLQFPQLVANPIKPFFASEEFFCFSLQSCVILLLNIFFFV